MALTVLNTKRQNNKPSFFARFERGPIADKFFIVALVAALLGILVFGIQVWLMREGILQVQSNYNQLRDQHLTLMLFGFFATVIVGFTIQAGPQMFQAQRGLNGLLRLIAFLSCTFATLSIFFLSNPTPRLLYTIPLCLSLISLMGYRDRLLTSPGSSLFIIIGHITLITCALTGYCSLAQHAFGALTAGVVGTILGAQQLFLSNLFSGRRLSASKTLLLSLIFVASVAGIVFEIQRESSALLLLAFLFLYAYLTEAWRVISFIKKFPLALALTLSFIWCIIGIGLAWIDPTALDRVNHIIATGSGATTVMAVTVHIVQFMSGNPNSKRYLVYAMIILWQFAPFVRGLYPAGGAGKNLIMISSLGMLISLILWIGLFLASESKVLRRQLTLRGKEEMPRV